VTGATAAQARRVAAAALLTAAVIAWAAAPVSGGRAGTRLALIVAVISGVASLGRLATGEDELERGAFDPPLVRLGGYVVDLVRMLPWAEVLIVAVLVLEALHRATPWHTALLGAALLAYVFAVHLAQTRSGPGTARSQLAVLAAGLGLLALAVGAAALPRLHAGAGSELLRVLAVVAAVLAGALALPTTGRRGRRGGSGGSGRRGGSGRDRDRVSAGDRG
jgi:hypothetical protein